MIGLLLLNTLGGVAVRAVAKTAVKAVVGVAVGTLVVGAGVAIYHAITKETIQEDAQEAISEQAPELLQDIVSIKIKEKSENALSLDCLDSWDEPIAELQLTADEIGDDLEVGDVISLVA